MQDALAQWLQNWGELSLAAAAAMALVFIVNGLVLVPRTFLCLGAGAIYGIHAIPIIVPSTTVGGVIGFLLARYFFASWLRRQVDERPRLRALMDGVNSESWRVVALLRFGSLVPTTVQTIYLASPGLGSGPLHWPHSFSRSRKFVSTFTSAQQGGLRFLMTARHH
jgi:uncharacterized membrane protein YdjX (TVP38/TMEM64 family)